MDSASIWEQLWPWAWPSALLILWYFVIAGGTAFLFEWLESRLLPVTDRRDERFLFWIRFVVVTTGVLFGGLLWSKQVPVPRDTGRFIASQLAPWIWPSIALAVWLVSAVFPARRFVAWLEQRAKESGRDLDAALCRGARRPVPFGVAIAGIAIWAGIVPFPDSVAIYVWPVTKGVGVVLLLVFGDAFVQGWMHAREKNSLVLATSGAVLRSGARILIVVIGSMMAMSSVGIDVTPILASLGVGSLAVGLALQGSMEDFIAGLVLAADQPVRVGDFIEIDDGAAGWILNIGWRTTRIRTRDDMHIILPNGKLSRATLVNRSLPRTEVSFTVPIGVSYSSDLDEVTRVVIGVAQKICSEHPKAISSHRPHLVFQGFGESAILLEVWLRAKNWNVHYAVKDAFIREIHKAFQVAGITIPFPIRTLDLPAGTRLNVARK